MLPQKKQLQNSENMENQAKFKNLPIAGKHLKFLPKYSLGSRRLVLIFKMLIQYLRIAEVYLIATDRSCVAVIGNACK